MNLQLSNQTYDFLNALVRIILPGLGTMYFALAEIWGLPYATEIVGTIVAITAFLGVVIILARLVCKLDDELVIDDRNPQVTACGVKSGKLFTDLETGKTLNLKVTRVPEDAPPTEVEWENEDLDWLAYVSELIVTPTERKFHDE